MEDWDREGLGQGLWCKGPGLCTMGAGSIFRDCFRASTKIPWTHLVFPFGVDPDNDKLYKDDFVEGLWIFTVSGEGGRWTFEGLDAARNLYEREGFRLRRLQDVGRWGREIKEQLFVLNL